MATKDDSTTTKTPAKAAPKAADPAPAKDADAKTPADTKADKHLSADEVRELEGERVSTCVVNGGRGMHVGNAVNGDVCSYHAMHYDSHGNRR